MILYHTSNMLVEKPDTQHSRPFLDFGRGFYLTSMREQAEKYGLRFMRRNDKAYMNVYELKDNLEDWSVLRFDSYSREWLDFVLECRRLGNVGDYDLIIGGIANDRVIETLNLFFDNMITADTALEKLKYEKPNIQYCIRSEKMLRDCLTFIKCEQL